MAFSLALRGRRAAAKPLRCGCWSSGCAVWVLPVTENQEPGATTIGRQIRRILLDPAHQEMAPVTELLLMFASRAQAAAEIILPALERGAIVVSDRFTDSSLAYQGEARGLGFETGARSASTGAGRRCSLI